MIQCGVRFSLSPISQSGSSGSGGSAAAAPLCPALSADDSRLYIYVLMGPGKLAGTFILTKHRFDIVTRGAWAFTRPHRPHNLNFPVKVSPSGGRVGLMKSI